MNIQKVLEASKKRKTDKKPSRNNLVAKHSYQRADTFPDKKNDYKRKPKHKKKSIPDQE